MDEARSFPLMEQGRSLSVMAGRVPAICPLSLKRRWSGLPPGHDGARTTPASPDGEKTHSRSVPTGLRFALVDRCPALDLAGDIGHAFRANLLAVHATGRNLAVIAGTEGFRLAVPDQRDFSTQNHDPDV